jgi:hypothetical protein
VSDSDHHVQITGKAKAKAYIHRKLKTRGALGSVAGVGLVRRSKSSCLDWDRSRASGRIDRNAKAEVRG